MGPFFFPWPSGYQSQPYTSSVHGGWTRVFRRDAMLARSTPAAMLRHGSPTRAMIVILLSYQALVAILGVLIVLTFRSDTFRQFMSSWRSSSSPRRLGGAGKSRHPLKSFPSLPLPSIRATMLAEEKEEAEGDEIKTPRTIDSCSTWDIQPLTEGDTEPEEKSLISKGSIAPEFLESPVTPREASPCSTPTAVDSNSPYISMRARLESGIPFTLPEDIKTEESTDEQLTWPADQVVVSEAKNGEENDCFKGLRSLIGFGSNGLNVDIGSKQSLQSAARDILDQGEESPSVRVLSERQSSFRNNRIKRFSTGGIGLNFGKRRSNEADNASQKSWLEGNIHTPTDGSLDFARLEQNLDRIQVLLEQNASQIRSMELVQAANWERLVNVLALNAEQISELGRGQQRLAEYYEELRSVASMSERSSICEHDVRFPPRKLKKKIVGYVYATKDMEKVY